MEPVPLSIPARLEHQAATSRASAQQQGKKRPTRGHRAQGESVEARTARIAAEAQEKEAAIETAMNKGVKKRDKTLDEARKQVFLAQNPQLRPKTEGIAESLAIEITGVEHKEEETRVEEERRVAEVAASVIPAAAGAPEEKPEVKQPVAAIKDDGPTAEEIAKEEEDFQNYAMNRQNTQEQDKADKELREALRKANEFIPPKYDPKAVEAAGKALLAAEEEMMAALEGAEQEAIAPPAAAAPAKPEDQLDDFYLVNFDEKKYWKTVVLTDDQRLTEKQQKKYDEAQQKYDEAQRPDQKEEKCVIS